MIRGRIAVAILAALACAPRTAPPPRSPVEAVSLLGDTLPDDLDSIIWLGRRTAYLGRYGEAIAIYTRGLHVHPDEPRLLRHRGHRYLSTRQLDRAVADLRRAAALVTGQPDRVEEDGLPNARGIPTSTLQSNIWYHLGLAHYVRGELEAARDAYRRGMLVSANPDMLTAMSYWLYLTLRRLGDGDGATQVLRAVRPDFDIIENHAYHRLMMLYQGRLPVDSLWPAGDSLSLEDVTAAYGVGAWHLIEGRKRDAARVFRRIVAARSQWPAFGYLAAEGELARDVPRLVVLVRHAEAEGDPPRDPPLTPGGLARAESLAVALAAVDIGAIVATPFQRTRHTAAPLAGARGIAPIVLDVAGGLAAHVRAVADTVRGRPSGEAVLVVGHSNTIPAIIAALGGPRLPDLCHREFATLFLLHLAADGTVRLVRARYGPGDDTAACE